jgi:hypothetical protein
LTICDKILAGVKIKKKEKLQAGGTGGIVGWENDKMNKTERERWSSMNR